MTFKERNGSTNIGLGELRLAFEEEFQDALYILSERYCKLLGVDFLKDILPHLKNKGWWEPDYGQASRDGKSIGMSVKDALKCLVDTHRTFQIYQGISETIKSLRSSGRDELIGIDAGTGTGILAIAMISLGVNKVYAIEINPESHAVTDKFLSVLGLNKQIRLLKGDATLIEIPELRERHADILVSENLSGGLFNEPQYDIIGHLSNFLFPEAEIIPNEAELYVSLASVDWEGVKPGKNIISVRRLRRYEKVSPDIKYAEVKSRVGMQIPVLEAKIKIPTEFKGPINALCFSTRFRINGRGQLFYLEPDTANFLGKTLAGRLSEGYVYAQDGFVDVSLKYEVGRETKNLKIIGTGNSLDLVDTMLKSKV